MRKSRFYESQRQSVVSAHLKDFEASLPSFAKTMALNP
jgi:hypothetical protein